MMSLKCDNLSCSPRFTPFNTQLSQDERCPVEESQIRYLLIYIIITGCHTIREPKLASLQLYRVVHNI